MIELTKCGAFWRKVQQFKENDDFKGFQEWCGYKSYEQARKDWNAFDTLLIIAKKVEAPVCEIVGKYKLSEDALEPIIHQRKDLPTGQFGKRETIPSAVQEKAIDILLPKIKSGIKVTEEDSKRAVSKAIGKTEKDWTKPPIQKPEKPPDIDTGILFTCEHCGDSFHIFHRDDGKHWLEKTEVIENVDLV